ncbi:hypothetical protein NT2_10_00570 [Caenibius tardaugens NBRC 16725]|uniref:DUF1003 domain-containing protein n=1 Tax=Caenibius tardaugens NBRC 16725 TaxID=1219035 RepID=U2YPL3_9SPHN|nr:DUF1003 domain-containing protein [Caenibius tardaugens]AZI35816.1 DUF1003 domain-containing protein [Caenibius tardaugens NBRC 16725]TXG98513.1 MAG: DUF1003 domain-containing protein [Rhodocyclaceae bacterium]GAD50612.1 hypothetical protein NT2_10_00570 [Caenibius tardaugens NBRC 16725]
MNAAARFLVGQFRRAQQVRNVNTLFDERQTFGERLADRVAAIGGSWTFIISFSVFLLAWAGLNTVVLTRHAFDPFPFIFLNLMLSMLAALQAPIIMMSQNRQAAKDRLEARLDYETNLRVEAEIACLHEKIDLMLAMSGDQPATMVDGQSRSS